MAKQLDPQIAEILKRHGYGPEACWNVHGTWVVYHRVLEQIAVKANITFDPPMVLESDGQNKTVAICVTGHMKGGPSQWSIGEASPHNYQVKGKQAAYPYAMAEKRAKDRVVLKLIGLHGLAYSEDEADDFKEVGPAVQQPKQEADKQVEPSQAFLVFKASIEIITEEQPLADWASEVKAAYDTGQITADERLVLIELYKARVAFIEQQHRSAA